MNILITIYIIWILSGIIPLIWTSWLEWNKHNEAFTLNDLFVFSLCFIGGIIIGIAAIHVYMETYGIKLEDIILIEKKSPEEGEESDEEDDI